ncbi:Ig-like domain-containing protein, partial [Salinicola socius]|uniref:Ig-like domain-containing protein n=1 Tax=Salinicola socius TaxID=404433 RepID=UPI0011825A3A
MAISAKVSALNEDVAAAPASAVGTDGTIALEQPRKVLLSLSPDDVQTLQRDGDDLLVRTTDGQVIRIENFYGADGNLESQLYLTGEDQELIWADLGPASSDGFIAADYIPQNEFGVFEPVTAAGEGGEGLGVTPLGWAAIGGGALAAGAVAAGGGGGGGSDDDDDTPPEDADDSDNEDDATPPDAPAINPSNGETISGEAEPGSTIIITDGDGNPVGETITGDDGNWTFTPEEPLPDGTDIDVVAQDPAGNTSQPTTGTIDASAPDAPTLDPSNGETISGEAEPGSTIIITDGDGNPVGETITGDDGNWTFTPEEPLPDGTDIDVVAQDPAGNTSQPTTGTIDASAPDAPTIDLSNGETLTGTAEPGSTVTLTDGDGNAIGDTTANGEGNWSFTPSEPLPDGTEVSATATDAAGNESQPVTTTIDALAPDAPAIDPTDGTLLTGTAEPGSTVTLTGGDGNPIGSAITDANGNWSFQPEQPLDDGTDVTATATDAAGNVSEPATTTVDGDLDDDTPPVTPTIAAASDDVAPQTGQLDDGDSTNDPTPRLTGRAEAGSTVTIFADGEEIGTTTANAQGNWSFTTANLDDGDTTFTVTATDGAGNVSNASAPFTLGIDTMAPNAPTLSPTDGTLLTGTAEPGSTVTLTGGDGDPIGSAITDDNGNWSFQPEQPLDDGTDVTATATDAAGNVSEPATTTVDGDLDDDTPPVTPTIAAASDDVAPQTGQLDDGDSTNDATPTLSGRAEARSVVTIYSGDDELSTVIADDDGSWSYTPDALDDGEYSFTVTATDSAGNVSDESAPFTLTIDTQPPATPIVDPTNGEILTGSAEAGSSVTLTDEEGDTIATVTSDINGNWSFAPDTPLPDDSTFTAIATDAAGNVSEPGSAVVDADLEDTLPPSEPVIITSIDAIEPGTGSVDDGDTTNDANPTLVGTAEATNTVQIWADAGDGMQMLGTTQADGFGNWSFRIFSRLAEGNTTFMARSIDPAGQTSEASSPYAVVIDTTPPDEPTIDSATDDVDPTGTLGDGDSTNDTTPALTGTAEANATVTISANGTVLGSVTADGDGNWSYIPETLGEGDVTFTATATDAAGNVSPDSPSFTLTLDETAPDAGDNGIAINDGGDGFLNVDEAGNVTLSGSIESDATVSSLIISDASGNTVTVDPADIAVDADGNLTVSGVDLSGLVDGELTATLSVTDAAGNTGTVTDTTTLDTAAPNAPTATLADDTAIDGDGITSDATINVGGLEGGATWEYSTDGGDSWTTGMGASFELPEGDYAADAVQVRQTDAAGNTGETANLGVVTVDLT